MRVIHVLRKPVSEGSIAANILQHGTGALNINASRIKVQGEVIHTPQSDPRKRSGTVGTDLGFTRNNPEAFKAAQQASITRTMTLGRWPANVVLSHSQGCTTTCTPECPVPDLDSQGGNSTTGRRSPRSQEAAVKNTTWGVDNHKSREYPNDQGGASRYFKQVHPKSTP